MNRRAFFGLLFGALGLRADQKSGVAPVLGTCQNPTVVYLHEACRAGLHVRAVDTPYGTWLLEVK